MKLKNYMTRITRNLAKTLIKFHVFQKTPPPPPPQQQQPRVSAGFFRKAADDIPTNAAPIGTYKVPSWDEATASTNTIFK